MKRKRNTKELEELPKSLVKFCNAETALSILNEGSLRWRTPHNLGDPFGYDQDSLLNFDSITLVEAVVQTATAMIFSSNVPVGHSPMLDAIRRWRDENRFATREEAQGVLKGLCSQMVQQRFVEIKQIQDDWKSLRAN